MIARRHWNLRRLRRALRGGAVALLIVSATLVLVGCSKAAASTEVNDSNSGRSVEMKVGDTLVVTLQGNPTTGYSWYRMGDDWAVLQQLGEYDFKPDTDALGSGGKVLLHFKATKAGHELLRLGYRRPWESVQPLKIFELEVTVK